MTGTDYNKERDELTMIIKPIGSNQTEVTTKAGNIILISYSTPVACYHAGLGKYLKTDKKWSVTTSKHIKKWLNGHDAETRPQAYFDTLL